MKRTFLYLLAGLVVAMLVICVALLWPAKRVSSGQLTLPDGSVVRVMAVTYGTDHVAGSMLARWFAKRPPRLRMLARRLFGVRLSVSVMGTTEPCMVVWLDRATNSAAANGGWDSFEAVLADETGFVSGGRAQLGWPSSSRLLYFEDLPRRGRHISLQFFHRTANGTVTDSGSLLFENPLHGRYPQWMPEALPTTKRVEDVEVTLNRLSTGHGETRHRRLPGGRSVIEFGTNGIEGNVSVCVFRLRSLTDSNEVWKVRGAQLSDATGNRVKRERMGLGWSMDNEDYITFAPSLWTNESAWRLECEIKRTHGFNPDQLMTFRNVPLYAPDKLGTIGSSNYVGWISNFLGVTLKLEYVIRRPNKTNEAWSSSEISQVVFRHAILTTNTHLDLLRMVMDTGQTNPPISWSASGAERTYSFRTIPLEARTADFTFAVHTSRWVQFMVKPEVRTIRLEYPSRPKGK